VFIYATEQETQKDSAKPVQLTSLPLLITKVRHYCCVVNKTYGAIQMTALSSLKLTAAKKTNNVPQVIARRNKISVRIQEQIEMALAEQNGTAFAVTKLRSYVDKESGLRKQTEVNKRVKAWWFTSDNGKLALAVKYGARVLELSKGKFAVELASAAELVPTLEIVKSAVEQGELDDAIDSAATKLRSGFKK
jgi:hypothetical protein